MSEPLSIVPIGTINPGATGFTIQLDRKYAEGLRGLADFSHAVVLWWASDADSPALRNQLIYERPYTNNPEDVGVFSTRSPSRINPIGLSVVAIERVDLKAANLTTPYIDTHPGTPVVDLKPYYAASDRVRDYTPPAWCRHWPACYEDSAQFDWESEFVDNS